MTIALQGRENEELMKEIDQLKDQLSIERAEKDQLATQMEYDHGEKLQVGWLANRMLLRVIPR